MKKLLVMSLLGCFTASMAYAGEVTLAGFLNYGVTVTKAKKNPTTVAFDSQTPDGNRIILRGVEDLSPGYKIGFTLTDVFNNDTGNLVISGKQFNFTRLFFSTPYGSFGGGRLAPFGSTVSPIGEWSDASPFGGGYGDAGMAATYDIIGSEAINNTIYYITNPIGGFKVGLLFSLTGKDDFYGEKFSRDSQFYEAFFMYESGPLKVMIDTESYRYGGPKEGSVYNHNMNTPYWAKAAVRYAVTPDMRLYAGFAYGKNQTKYNVSSNGMASVNNPYGRKEGKGIDSYSGHIGFDYDLGANTFMAQYQLQMGKNHMLAGEEKESFSRHVFGIGHNYHISKRTYTYLAASYSLTTGALKNTVLNRAMFMGGIAHSF